MRQQQPDPILAKRAAKVWRDLCRNPNKDNGDKSIQGLMSQGLMAMVEKTATDEVMDKFEAALFEGLQKLRKYDYGNPDSGTYYENRISCDYGPCGVIREAMKSSGADFSNPIKTTIWVGDGWISVSAGYAATPVYHYPISEDRYARGVGIAIYIANKKEAIYA